MDWKTAIPTGLEHTLVWRGTLRFLDDPMKERRAMWEAVGRVDDPLRFALSGRGELRGWFSLEPDMTRWPVTGRMEWYIQEKREVLFEGTYHDAEGISWRLIGRRPWGLRSASTGFGHLHCQLLKDEQIVAVGVLSSGVSDWGHVLSSVKFIGGDL